MFSTKRDAVVARRERALKTFFELGGASEDADLANAAIEVAARVKITDETIEAFDVARTGCGNEGIRMGLRAALIELGFEVEE